MSDPTPEALAALRKQAADDSEGWGRQTIYALIDAYEKKCAENERLSLSVGQYHHAPFCSAVSGPAHACHICGADRHLDRADRLRVLLDEAIAVIRNVAPWHHWLKKVEELRG